MDLHGMQVRLLETLYCVFPRRTGDVRLLLHWVYDLDAWHGACGGVVGDNPKFFDENDH